MAKPLKPRIKSRLLLSASIICSDFNDLIKDLKLLKIGGADLIHVDVMDGIFVPRLGIFPELISAIKKNSTLPLDVHLMIQNPSDYIPIIAKSGADYITVHAEIGETLGSTIQQIRAFGIKAGICIKPETSPKVISRYLQDIDLILVMGIHPGILGQKLIPTTYEQIAGIKKIATDYPDLIIEVDGGVNFETSPQLIKFGANSLVCGSSTIFGQNEPIDKQLLKLRKILSKKL